MSFFLDLEAHHTGSSDSFVSTSRFVDPFTGKREKPATYVVLTQDYYQSTRENSNQYTTTGFVETNFFDGRFAINASVPWNYYEQRNRQDAARIGKPYVGVKYQPFFDLSKPYFVVFQGSVGFPSGPDTDRFTGGDFYAGSANLTFGFMWNQFSWVGKMGGIRPLSRNQPNNLQDNDGIPYPTRLPSQKPPDPRYEYLNSFITSTYITYYWKPQISFFAGILYRNPYNGVEFDKNRDTKNPNYFTEGSLGFSYNFSEKYNLNLVYRVPTQRDTEFRLYYSAITMAFSMELGSSD